MTFGRGSIVADRLNDGRSDPWHEGVHAHPLTAQEFGHARVAEFLDASARLGVTGVIVNDFGDSLETEEVTSRIDWWLD